MLCEKCACELQPVLPIKTIKEVITIGSKFFNVNEDILKSPCREQWIYMPRYYIIMYLLSVNYSLKKIGNEFNRDHSTILYSRKKMYSLMSYDAEIVKTLENFKFFVNQ